MNYSEFVNKYLGKSTDYDCVYGVQCVDLIKAYLHDVFGISAGSWGNARFYWINFALRAPLKSNFIKIRNTPQLIPKRGDIVVWNNSVGNGAGHIAIATGEGDTRSFYSYDQNWNGKPMKRLSTHIQAYMECSDRKTKARLRKAPAMLQVLQTEAIPRL